MNIQKIKVSNVNNIQPIKVKNTQQIIINMDLQDKVVIPTQEQQIVKPDLDFDALSQVIVEPIPDDYAIVEGTFDITNNGEYDVKSYAGVNVDVQPNLGTKIIDKNGVYNASDDNLDGYSQVNVETSGVDINDYFQDTYLTSGNLAYYSNAGTWMYFLNKLPRVNISNIRNLNYLYARCGAKYIDTSGVDTTNVTSLSNLLYWCNNLLEIDFKNWDTSKVTDMSYLCYYCQSLKKIDVSSFDTRLVTTMRSMFANDVQLEELDLSNFITPKLTMTRDMFSGCNKLMKLDIRNFEVSAITTSTNMFNGVPANCEIIVKDSTTRDWILAIRNDFSNIKTVAEKEAE